MRYRTGQLFLWCFCAEWLLLQRRWLSSSTVALMTLMILARAWLLQTVPLVALYPYAGAVCALVAVIRFFKAFSLAARRRRAHYQVPPWGLPWASFLTGPRPVPSALGSKLIEPLTAAVVSLALVVLQDTVVPPRVWLSTLTQLPALVGWDVWMMRHPVATAKLVLVLPWIMLVVHNHLEWRSLQPRQVRQRTEMPPELFPRVRERRLPLPPVPSVHTLAKRFNRHSGVG